MLQDYFLGLMEWWRTSVILRNKKSKPTFKKGEIWWASIGMNIGVEIFGKGDQFARPVIIYKKFNEDSFLAIPLTTKSKEGKWYSGVMHGSIPQTAIFSQIRTLDAKRLIKRMGTLNDIEFRNIQIAFSELYGPKKIFTPHEDVEAGCSGRSQ